MLLLLPIAFPACSAALLFSDTDAGAPALRLKNARRR